MGANPERSLELTATRRPDVATLTTPTTMAELLEQLGDIPPERVRLRPTPGTATERDVVKIHNRERRLCELVDGVLVEKPMAYYKSHLAMLIGTFLQNFNEQHDLGVVTGADGMMRLAKGLVRIPDVAFVDWDKFPNRTIPRTPIPALVPDLAVEVLSESNTAREMARKLDEYFDLGVRLVWIVDPETESVEVFASRNQARRLDRTGTLDGGDVLPGLKLALRRLFKKTPRGR